MAKGNGGKNTVRTVEQLVRQCLKHESIDRNRLYVLGISMGGMGTFDYICRHPRRFACAIRRLKELFDSDHE